MKRAFVGGALAALTALPAAAQEPPRLAPVVVTATRVATPEERLGASVTVITEDELRTQNHTRIEEALRQVPGVEIERSGGPGKLASIRIRGAGSAQVQVLVDGMRVKSPTLGTADLSELSLDGVERIEVIRGPQSSLYGADAIGGVVNIITRKGQGPPRGRLEVEGGSYATFRERASFEGAAGGFNAAFSVSRFDHGGQRDNDDAEQTALAGRIGYDFPWKGELSLSGRYSKTALDLPVDSAGPPTVFDPNAQQQVETWLYNLTYRQPLARWWEVSARYGQWWNNSGFQDDPPPATDTPLRSQINTRRREFEVVNVFPLAAWTTLTAGAEHRNERGRNRGAFREEINTIGAFVQDELRVLDRVFLTGSLRWEDNDVFGDELTPRLAAAILVKETGSRLHASWGHGFRAPTINDLFFPGFGNPDLKPERAESYDVGLDQKLWKDRVRLGATYFHNEFEDLIQFAFVGGQFLPFNVSRARTQGVEAYAEVEPVHWLLLSVNYTRTSAVDKDTHQPLRRFAPHRWNAGVTVTPTPRLSLFARAHVVSSQFESTAAGRNPGWHRIDVGGTWRLWDRAGIMERLELTARVENLSDERYDEVLGFRALGFNALVGLRAYFQ
jgi:vitamin B12 transporter